MLPNNIKLAPAVRLKLGKGVGYLAFSRVRALIPSPPEGQSQQLDSVGSGLGGQGWARSSLGFQVSLIKACVLEKGVARNA